MIYFQAQNENYLHGLFLTLAKLVFLGYAKAAAKLKEIGVFLAKVDVTKEAELAKEYFVQGYPTLIIFKNGDKLQDYTGEKNADAIISHMTALNDPNWVPPPSDILGLTAENFTKFVKNEKLSLVLFYAPWCKHCKQVFPGTDIILYWQYLLAAHMHPQYHGKIAYHELLR